MIKNLIALALFILSIMLVIKGNTVEGFSGLIIMLCGVVIILAEVYLYNRQYQ